jgi:hypothetical protein
LTASAHTRQTYASIRTVTTAHPWPQNASMCFGARNKNEDGEARSREVDKVLRQDEKRMAKEVKLLLLGKPWFLFFLFHHHLLLLLPLHSM